MTLEEKIDLLIDRQLCHTQFDAVIVEGNNRTGIQIGIGKCKAVILKLNKYELNSTDGTLQEIEQVYIGDSTMQTWELEAGKSSDIIFCNDLSEVYVRVPDGETANIQLLIYV